MFSGECAEKDISFVGAIYEDFPDPGEKPDFDDDDDVLILADSNPGLKPC